MGHTQDDVGIAKIEEFLDRIEDPDEAVFDAFQDTFNIVKESLKLNDEEGSEEFLKNKAKAEELSAKVWFEIQQNKVLQSPDWFPSAGRWLRSTRSSESQRWVQRMHL